MPRLDEPRQGFSEGRLADALADALGVASVDDEAFSLDW